MARKPKTLEVGSEFEHLDADGDGVITDDEMARAREIAEFKHKQVLRENEDKKQDAQRGMAWFALFGMLLYPAAIIATSWFGIDNAAGVLGDMAPTYFVSVAAIVAAFYGTQAYAAKSDSGSKKDENW
jgi:hypothetical protein